MSKEGENEIFNRTEVLQEVPSSIVISEDSEGQESMASLTRWSEFSGFEPSMDPSLRPELLL